MKKLVLILAAAALVAAGTLPAQAVTMPYTGAYTSVNQTLDNGAMVGTPITATLTWNSAVVSPGLFQTVTLAQDPTLFLLLDMDGPGVAGPVFGFAPDSVTFNLNQPGSWSGFFIDPVSDWLISLSGFGGTGADAFLSGGLFNFEINLPGRDPSNVVPEPTTMVLLGSGLLGLAGRARRKK